MQTFLTASFHLGVFTVFCYAIYYDLVVLNGKIPEWLTFAGRWKYLTWWNGCFQAVFYGLSFINDVLGNNIKHVDDHTKRPLLQRFCDYLFACVVWPAGNFVVFVFWILYHIKVELVWNPERAKVVPAWNSHVYHTFVLPFLIIEYFLVYHHYPKRKIGISIIASLTMIYLSWVFFIAYHSDIWVYKVLAVLHWPGRTLFLMSALAVMIDFYLVGECLMKKVWKNKS